MSSLQKTHGLLFTGLPPRGGPPLLLPIRYLLKDLLGRDFFRLLGRQRLVRVARRQLHYRVAQHVVRDAQDALELDEGALARRELHDDVEAVGAVVYLVGELAASPVVGLAGLAARALDYRAETPDRVLDLLLVELGDHYEHGFVSVDVCLLRSSVGFFRKRRSRSLWDYRGSVTAGSSCYKRDTRLRIHGPPGARVYTLRVENGAGIAVESVGLERVYGQGPTAVRALEDLSPSFPNGGFAAIMDPSGSGKSTLLHILGALDKPTSGRVIVGNTELSR